MFRKYGRVVWVDWLAGEPAVALPFVTRASKDASLFRISNSQDAPPWL